MKMKAIKKMKQFVSFMLVLALCLAMIPVLDLKANAASMDDYLFQTEWYSKYPDLQKAFGKNASKLRNHYINHGMREGRSPSDIFDPVYYLNKYPDLKAAFGNDYKAAYTHFINNGIREGRQASEYFNVEIYKSNYSDLQKAFGTRADDNWEYIRHWSQYGRKEGRNAVTKISTPSGATTSNNNSPTQTTTTMYVKTRNPNNRLNMRSSASTLASIVAKLSYGTEVTVFSISNGWAKVTVNGKSGYVSSHYLSKTKPSSTVTTTENDVVYTYKTVTLDTSNFSNWAASLTAAQKNCKGSIVSQTVNQTRKMTIHEPIAGPTLDGKALTKSTTINMPYKVTFKLHTHTREFGYGASWRYQNQSIVTQYTCSCGYQKDLVVWEIPLPEGNSAQSDLIDTINRQAQQYYWINNMK